MPPQDVVNASQQLKDLMSQLLEKQRLNHGGIQAFATPRRLVAAKGFCRRYAVPLDSLFRKVDGKTEYVYACVRESARVALEVLSEELPAVLAKVSFPKSRHWNSQQTCSLDYGPPWRGSGSIYICWDFQVESAESYSSIMKNAGIDIQIEDRKKIILERSSLLAKSVNGNIVFQESLLSEVVNLVEAPVPVLGKFNESFLELPESFDYGYAEAPKVFCHY